MYEYGNLGGFPTPHSGALSAPEFLQQLYTKIDECVKKVSECITLVDTSNNIIDNWNNLKAECDMVMEQYANIMNGYDNDVGNYVQVLNVLDGRLADLSASSTYLEELVSALRTEVDTKTEEVRKDLATLSEYVIESGTANEWEWRRYNSGRVECTKRVLINLASGGVQYDGNVYYYEVDLPLPIPMDANALVWATPTKRNTTCYVVFCANTYAKIGISSKDLNQSSSVHLCVRVEGHVPPEVQ